MDEELAKLIEQARNGDWDPWLRLVDALRQRSQDKPALLVEWARSADELLRRAAISAAAGRNETEIREAIAQLVRDPHVAVRQCLANNLGDSPNWLQDDLLQTLLDDPDPVVRPAAVYAARNRPGLYGAALRRLHQETNAWTRGDMAYHFGAFPARDVVADLLRRLTEDLEINVQQAAASSLELHLNNQRGWPAGVTLPSGKDLLEARRRVQALTQGSYPNLLKWLNEQLHDMVDVEVLSSYGTLLTQEAIEGKLTRAYEVEPVLEAVLPVLSGPPPRAVVLLGESGSGKTASVNELVYRLRDRPGGPWYVLRLAPADFMKNTRYLGEWETRVANIVAAVKAPRKVIVYVPNLEELAWMGTWEKSSASVASALAPSIERGDITILGESTVEGFRKGLGADRSLRRLFHAVELPPADAARTRAIVQQVARDAGAELADGLIDRLGDLADFFVSGSVQPGRSVGLLRRTLGTKSGRAGLVTETDVLATIAHSTGIPVNFLDDNQALDRAQARAFFEARIMGQPEGVDAVVDLVTLIKAGLTDPNKPFGVLLFIGPTGVGKTELARALAEHLFGDAGRMIRLDMSEFATYEAFERLIGQGHRGSEPGILTAAVREKPFAVLLLDEIEKAHPNIYNLCLQIFDAGRLTDTQGRTTDFRRTIIILTSNVGSAVPTEGGVGFGKRTARAPDRDVTLRELGRWFRPEFLNRIDRIVVFNPLALETAEKIARREVARVLERGGITRRRLAVDVGPDVLPILLREGYSPAYGARPLKRTIERLVLLPVARVIAEGKAPAGSLLRLVARGGHIDVEVAPPDTVESAETPAPAPRALPVRDRAVHLVARLDELRARAEPLAQRKSQLLAQSAGHGFWDDPHASRRLLDEVYRLDGILAGLDELEKKVRVEAERSQRYRTSARGLAIIEQRLEGLESQLEQTAFLVRCQPRELGDALVTLRRIAGKDGGLEGVKLLASMYQAFARRRGFEVEVVDDRQDTEPPEDTVTLMVSGTGAYGLLAGETGLHQLARGKPDTPASRRRLAEREVVRVEVLPVPLGTVEFSPQEVKTEVKTLDNRPGRLLARRKFEVHLFHLPSMTSLRAQCDGTRAEALSRVQALLRARLEGGTTSDEAGSQVIRRYRLGPTTLVRDQRSGKHTARLDQVLKGYLDRFLVLRAQST